MWPDAAIVLWLNGVSSERPPPPPPFSPPTQGANGAITALTATPNTIPPTPPTPPDSLEAQATRKHHSRKRRYTEDMPGDNAATPTKRSKRGRQDNNLDVSAGTEINADPNATPRAPTDSSHPLAAVLNSKPAFDPSSAARSHNPSSMTSLSESLKSSDSAASLKRKWDEDSQKAGSHSPSKKGSRSPDKALRDRIYAPYGVSLQVFRRLQSLPPSAHELVTNMNRYFDGRGVIPEQYKSWIAELALGLPSDDDRILAKGAQEGERKQLGGVPEPRWTQRLVDKAIDRELQGADEAAWNTFVHAPLLQKALELSPFEDSVLFEIITTARIHPSNLVPERSAGQAADSKRVDFCFCLDLGLDTKQRKALLGKGLAALNQTDYPPVQFHPIAISIGTKRSYTGKAEALLQLETWAAAQVQLVKRLLELANSPYTLEMMPPLPLLLVVGHEWRFYWMEDRGSSAFLWRDVRCIETSSAAGVYGIIAGLQYLISWSYEVYKPWFLKHIVNPLLELEQGDEK